MSIARVKCSIACSISSSWPHAGQNLELGSISVAHFGHGIMGLSAQFPFRLLSFHYRIRLMLYKELEGVINGLDDS